MEDIIIFGAGKMASKNREWAEFAGYRVLFFVDNDPGKWGGTIDGIPVCSPGILKDHSCRVLFSDLYGIEIETQLKEMSYRGQRTGVRQLKKEAVCSKDINITLPKVQSGREAGFVFDAYFPGSNWGGVESFSCMVAGGLSELGVRTCLLCGPNERFDEFADHCLHFSGGEELELVKEMAVKIAESLPCIFISHASVALYAAQIVRSVFPDQIQVVIVAHGDEKNTYETLCYWADQVDKIVCISKKIQSEFQNRYGLSKDILLYRPNPIQLPALAEKKKPQGSRLKIGFAARLRKEQKRVHLLPEIIDACVERKLNVEFHIAGEGECLELLQAYVEEKHLEESVHLAGWIAPVDMADFWEKQNVYLNISDFEGMSLAMLEAMACGAVPVVTEVSGVSDLIEDGKNGFIVSVDNSVKTADKIEILSKDRDMLQRASDHNRCLIREKCDVSDYAKWLMETFHF